MFTLGGISKLPAVDKEGGSIYKISKFVFDEQFSRVAGLILNDGQKLAQCQVEDITIGQDAVVIKNSQTIDAAPKSKTPAGQYVYRADGVLLGKITDILIDKDFCLRAYILDGGLMIDPFRDKESKYIFCRNIKKEKNNLNEETTMPAKSAKATAQKDNSAQKSKEVKDQAAKEASGAAKKSTSGGKTIKKSNLTKSKNTGILQKDYSKSAVEEIKTSPEAEKQATRKVNATDQKAQKIITDVSKEQTADATQETEQTAAAQSLEAAKTPAENRGPLQPVAEGEKLEAQAATKEGETIQAPTETGATAQTRAKEQKEADTDNLISKILNLNDDLEIANPLQNQKEDGDIAIETILGNELFAAKEPDDIKAQLISLFSNKDILEKDSDDIFLIKRDKDKITQQNKSIDKESLISTFAQPAPVNEQAAPKEKEATTKAQKPDISTVEEKEQGQKIAQKININLPYRILADYKFLIGRLLAEDIIDDSGYVVGRKNDMITAKCVLAAHERGLLLELTKNSRL